MFWMIPILAMLIIGDNVTGWNELFSGHIIEAAFVMYDTALMGWTVVILFAVYQFMLWMKTRNLVLGWITGAIFASMYIGSQILTSTGNPVVKPIAVQIIFVLLVFELAAIIFVWLTK